METIKSKPIMFVILFYLVCWFFRLIEYFLLRTDQSILGEAIVHKLLGIGLLAVVLLMLAEKWRDIGFIGNKFPMDIMKGLLLGVSAFFVAYTVEIIVQLIAGNSPTLSFFVSSYSISGNRSLDDSVWLLFFCIVGNIINVTMEEGVFRGLFVKKLEEKHSFLFACIFSSLLFGIWHIAQPIRNVIDGDQSLSGAVMSAVLLVVTSTLLGIQYCMLNNMTGTIWAGMAAHFINNTTINLLHVSSASGIDQLQVMRISIAQSISFIIVLVIFLIVRKNRNNKAKYNSTGAIQNSGK